MNKKDYEKIMDAFSPDAEMKERMKKKLEARVHGQSYGQHGFPKSGLPVRRALSAACLALLVSMCMITVAFAANPKLRTTFLAFFHIEETEQLPGTHESDDFSQNTSGNSHSTQNTPKNGNPAQKNSGLAPEADNSTQNTPENNNPAPDPQQPSISDASIGGRVKAQYIRLNGNYGMQCGLLTQVTWNEDKTAIRSARFWEQENGKLKEIDISLRTTAFETTWQGTVYSGKIYSFVHNGMLGFYTGETRAADGETETDWYVSEIPGQRDDVLLHLSRGRQSDYREYVLLCHLKTGETEDFLAGTGAEHLDFAYDYQWSQNLTYALITCKGENGSPRTLLCDTEKKTLYELHGLTGINAEGAAFAGENTLLLFSYEQDDAGIYERVSCHTYDLITGQTRLTLGNAAYYHWWDEASTGVISFSGRCCVRIEQDRSVSVLDLTTGKETTVEDFVFHKNGKFSPSPDGNKFLYFATDPDADDFSIKELGVLDMERKCFLTFDRESHPELIEEGIGWDTDEQVVIRARSADDETAYIILYQF